MNDTEKNVSTDQQQPVTQEPVSQSEDISPPDETMITSSLQAGINYCRCMADQMFDEIKGLQEQWDSTRQTNRVLKQNLIDLDNEKQKLIANFHEEFRKFASLNGCVKRLEEEVLSLREFLDASINLEKDISQSKIEELKIRTSIKALFEEKEAKLQEIELSVRNYAKKVEEQIRQVEVFEAEQKLFHGIAYQLKSLVQNFDGKIKNLHSSNNFTQEAEEIKRSIDLLQVECKAQTASVEVKRKEIPVQVKLETEIVWSRHEFHKNKIESEFASKQNLISDLKTEIANKLNQITELDHGIKTERDAVQNSERVKTLNQKELCDFEIQLQALKQEENKIREVICSLSKEVQSLREDQRLLSEQQESLQANIKQLEHKKGAIIKNLEALKDKIDLNKKLTEIQSLRVSSQAENDQHAQEKQTLIAKKDSLDKEKVDLMNEISAEKELIFKLQEISQRNRVSQISANEEESDLMEQLRLIRAEEYSLHEHKEKELNEMTDKFQKIFSNFTDLEFSLSQGNQENNHLEEEIRSKRKTLKVIAQDDEFFKSSIQRIKQNVYNGTFITMQELNKKYNLMVNGKNVETERVDKLKQEIANLKARLNSRKESSRDAESENFSAEIDVPLKAKKSRK